MVANCQAVTQDLTASSSTPEALTPREAAVSPAVLNVQQVAGLLSVSTRHVYRMVDGGLMPRPLKLGGLNRWPKAAIEKWLMDGAPAVRD